MQRTQARVVDVTFSVVKGSLFWNWTYLGFDPTTFRGFFDELLRQMGFPNPRTVYIERGVDGKVNWSRPRISQEECEMNQVDPSMAVYLAKDWLESSDVRIEFDRIFNVTVLV